MDGGDGRIAIDWVEFILPFILPFSPNQTVGFGSTEHTLNLYRVAWLVCELANYALLTAPTPNNTKTHC